MEFRSEEGDHRRKWLLWIAQITNYGEGPLVQFDLANFIRDGELRDEPREDPCQSCFSEHGQVPKHPTRPGV
jgi:hypothetical protein